MRKLTVRILAAVISAIFVIALVFLGMSISSDYKNGIKEAQIHFESIANYTKTLNGFYEPETPEFLEALKTRLSTETKYYKLSVTCNGKEIFSEFFHDSKPNFSPKEFSANVSAQVGVTLTLKASYAVINAQNIFDSAKISFYLILTGTILAIALLILQTVLMARNSGNEDEIDLDNIEDESDYETDDDEDDDEILIIDETEDEDSDTSDAIDESEVEDSPVEETEEETFETSEIPETPEKKVEEISVFSEPEPDYPEENFDEVQSFFEDDEPSETEEESQKPTTDENEIKKEEAQFESELNEEIANAAALEQDLSLVLLQCKDYLNARPVFDNAMIHIKDSNSSEKLSVHNYKDGFAVILKSTDLDKALKVGEELHAKILQTLKDYGISTLLSTGISSRTERMITGSRLIAEAEQACEHGYEDQENSVVAFRVDPELYKKFLAEQGA